MKRLIPFALAFGAATFACGPKPRIPFDPSVVPAGQGWYCFAHNEPGLVDLGGCFRSEAECYVEKKDVLVEPALNPLQVWLFHGETPGPWALAGGAIVIGATLVQSLSLRRRFGSPLATSAGDK